MKFNIGSTGFSLFVLSLMAAAVVLSLWRAHMNKDFDFNLFDLFMENGRVSKISFAFMTVLLTTTWLIIHLTISGRLTEGYLGLYLTAWVTPLIARVVFNKQDPVPTKSAADVLVPEQPK